VVALSLSFLQEKNPNALTKKMQGRRALLKTIFFIE
jgi:hypothetical protein